MEEYEEAFHEVVKAGIHEIVSAPRLTIHDKM